MASLFLSFFFSLFLVSMYVFSPLFVKKVQYLSPSRHAKAQRATLVLAHAANDQGATNEHDARGITFRMLVLDGSPRCGESANARRLPIRLLCGIGWTRYTQEGGGAINTGSG